MLESETLKNETINTFKPNEGENLAGNAIGMEKIIEPGELPAPFEAPLTPSTGVPRKISAPDSVFVKRIYGIENLPENIRVEPLHEFLPPGTCPHSEVSSLVGSFITNEDGMA